MASGNNPLNFAQREYLHQSLQSVDGLLVHIESILHVSTSVTIFPKYRDDISPQQSKVIKDHIALIRSQMMNVLNAQGIERRAPETSSSHAINTTLTAILIILNGLEPEHMKGYGEQTETAVLALGEITSEFSRTIKHLSDYLSEK